MILSDDELKELLEAPEALTVLVDYHGQQETMADAMDYVKEADFHKRRAEAFRTLRTDAETRRAAKSQETK